jgi:signal peptidase I
MEENLHEDLKVADEKEKRKKALTAFLVSAFDFIKTVLTIIILAIVIRLFIVQPYIVEGQSMEQSFKNNDYLITEKISYKFREPERGEVIIFHPPDNPSISYIKRVIGLPGDKIDIKDGSIYINDAKLNEAYLSSNEETVTGNQNGISVVLSKDEYYVFGDNRNHSRDSREIGPIPKANIISRVWFRLLPINQVKAFAAVDYVKQ